MTRAASVIATLFALGFTIAAAREHVARGGPMRVRTIASNSSNHAQAAEATLLLFAHASRTLPRGATVAVFKPRSRGEDAAQNRIAHGQLPYHRVVPVSDLSTDHPPDYVITFDGALSDPRYAHLHQTWIGSIWQRMP
ncbi:MAG TPA: hypothetical protein VGF28_08570 [Thermoanaerobaculia bacterium]|jgi:hypothetical protein